MTEDKVKDLEHFRQMLSSARDRLLGISSIPQYNFLQDMALLLSRLYAESYINFYSELLEQLPQKGEPKYITVSKDGNEQVHIKIEILETVPVETKKKWYKFW